MDGRFSGCGFRRGLGLICCQHIAQARDIRPIRTAVCQKFFHDAGKFLLNVGAYQHILAYNQHGHTRELDIKVFDRRRV